MPTYDYQCHDCGHVWEVRLHQATGVPDKCPLCGGQDIHRLFPAPYIAKGGSRHPGHTCCGRQERCEKPPCSTGEGCRKR
ncbi:zinc ribbon domain-containing protein [Desulfofundulus thermobenzoicus]|uniref:Zinc ribbon domain-containing protein n=2 Tax=Desulfofundulus thermobenzoicus TaxID=29376 RepID=A0A6N7INI0_9FIRM|nr:zinc ribbon domain-containing protein [Desulfofundulus thermobenzoicus]